jgi:hypothetical protein
MLIPAGAAVRNAELVHSGMAAAAQDMNIVDSPNGAHAARSQWAARIIGTAWQR